MSRLSRAGFSYPRDASSCVSAPSNALDSAVGVHESTPSSAPAGRKPPGRPDGFHHRLDLATQEIALDLSPFAGLETIDDVRKIEQAALRRLAEAIAHYSAAAVLLARMERRHAS